jgi:hypothetical protein
MLDQPSPTVPPVDEQIKILTEASERYAEVYRAHGVAAIAFPTIPMVAMPIRQGGPKEPFGEMITLNGQQMEETFHRRKLHQQRKSCRSQSGRPRRGTLRGCRDRPDGT